LILEHESDPQKRLLQKALAREVTVFVHGEDEFQKALETTHKLFSNQNAPVESLSKESLENMEGIIRLDIPRSVIENGVDITSFLVDFRILPSRSEARKMILNGGISLNRAKVESHSFNIDTSHLLHESYLLVQKGKKNFYLARIV
jgi:tyrosyl-tRNA synthetase